MDFAVELSCSRVSLAEKILDPNHLAINVMGDTLSVLPVLASARAGAGGSALPPRPKMAAGIRRRFGLAYGPHGQRNLLDLYLPAAGPGWSTRSVFSSNIGNED